MKKKPQGGRRPGAGRKPRDPSGPGKVVSLRLTSAEEAIALKFGPTVAEGIRELIRRAGEC